MNTRINTIIVSFSIICFLGLGSVVSAEEAKGFTYDDRGKRDPFWKLVSPRGTINNYESDLMISDLSLQGIMSGASGNIAMINGKIVKVNDKVAQFIITEITDDWVLLKKDDKIFKLKLKKEE